jgi:UDP-glucose 4-epimerase
MKVLITGGAGYIGSATARALEAAGHVPVILDSLLSGPRQFVGDRLFYQGDIADRALVARVLGDHPDIGCTIHMAARIVVPESVEQPYEYYRDNVAKSLELFDQLATLGQTRLVFSSSASIYAAGESEVREDAPLGPGSPYARTKAMIESVLEDLAAATPLRVLSLRYFNPLGAEPSLTTGAYVRRPSHVLGQLLMAVRGEQPAFTLTGTDYPTRDGSGLRDYLHVWDLARAHVSAVEQLDSALERAGRPALPVNVGTGQGVTVRELIATVERVAGRAVPVVEGPRRAGDSPGAFANVDRAADLLGWRSELSVEDGVRSALQWLDRRVSVLGW